MGVRNVALKLGSQGVFLAGRDCIAQQVPAFPVKAVDTTAAGDCFNAAFAVALTRGKPPVEAARYGAAAAAISVTRAGAQPSLPSSAEVEAFLAQELKVAPGLRDWVSSVLSTEGTAVLGKHKPFDQSRSSRCQPLPRTSQPSLRDSVQSSHADSSAPPY